MPPRSTTPASSEPRVHQRLFHFPFYSPLLIGPPAALIGGMLGAPWLGALLMWGATTVIVRDARHSTSRTSSHWDLLRSVGIAFAICAFWLALAIGLIMGFCYLAFPSSSD